MRYQHRIGLHTHQFADLKAVMACATPVRSGDRLAGIAAESSAERMAARMTPPPSRRWRSSRWGAFATGCCRMPPTARRCRACTPASRPRWWPR